MNVAQIRIYDLFRKQLKLDDEAAKEAVAIIKETIDEEIKTHHNEYKSMVAADIQRSEINIRKNISDVELKIEQTKTELMKWMFVFWTTSVIATLGGLIAIVKFMITE